MRKINFSHVCDFQTPNLWFPQKYTPVSTPSSYSSDYRAIKGTGTLHWTKYTLCNIYREILKTKAFQDCKSSPALALPRRRGTTLSAARQRSLTLWAGKAMMIVMSIWGGNKAFNSSETERIWWCPCCWLMIYHTILLYTLQPELKGKIQGRVEEQQLKECSQVLRSKIATKIVEPMMVKYQK